MFIKVRENETIVYTIHLFTGRVGTRTIACCAPAAAYLWWSLVGLLLLPSEMDCLSAASLLLAILLLGLQGT